MTSPPDLRDNLQTTLGSGYTVERELAGGGMSRVFLARDRTLDRAIVIKVLPAEAADVPIERFKREIALAARLQHPHIVPLLAAGELHKLPYYTMPYVEGESLRARLNRGDTEELPISECVSILKDVARALAYAHEHGVVHRDIKPENVLITGGSAVVTDFGIAKAIVTARTGERGQVAGGTLTEAGIAVGTPAYMAPEQISGEASADHRIDVYAFGCIAYEMLAGAPPFAGRTPHKLFAAHLSELPQPVDVARPECPSQLARLVMNCLEKDPALRAQSASVILQTLDGVSGAGARRSWPMRMLRGRRSVAGVVVLLVIAAAVIGFVSARVWRDAGAAATRIAVIPFANVGGDSTQQYFADGVSDELTTALGRVPGLKVASRQLAYRYRGQRDVDPRSIGRALDVAYVVQGSVRRAGGRLRLSAQLTSTSDGAEIWADDVERDSTQVFAVQDTITRSIAARLRPRTPEARATVSTQGTSNPEAYDLYLRGRFLLARRGEGVRLSIENFEQAIERDPAFARAHGELALALELMPYFGNIPAPDIRARAWEAAQRALMIDSTLAEAHAALGMLYEHEYQWKPAIAELRRAIAYDPDDASVHHQYGRVLMYVGDVYGAKAQFEESRRLDPYSAVVSGWLAIAFANLGQSDSAVAELSRAMQIDSTNLISIGAGAQTLVDIGRIDEARALARRMPDSHVFRRYKGYVLARTGDREGALRFIEALRRHRPPEWLDQTSIALAALGLRDTALALTSLERATDKREIWPTYVGLTERVYDPIRQTPRFAALVRRVGLNEKLFTQPNGGRPTAPAAVRSRTP